jgi:hypothetical protein
LYHNINYSLYDLRYFWNGQNKTLISFNRKDVTH